MIVESFQVTRATIARAKRLHCVQRNGAALVGIDLEACQERNYRPQFYFRTTDVTGEVVLPEGTEMVMPGDNVTLSVKLIAPIAMDPGLRFAIREGGRTVGAGVVGSISK